MMEHETTLEYTVPLLREAVAGFWRRSVGVGMLIALTIGAGMLSFSPDSRRQILGCRFAWSCDFFGAMFVVAIDSFDYRSAVQKFRDMGSPRAIFKASDDSFTVSSGAGTATLPWSSVTQVWKFRHCWLLLFSKAQFITLPLASISEKREPSSSNELQLPVVRLMAKRGRIGSRQ